jgi:hypothetical protein
MAKKTKPASKAAYQTSDTCNDPLIASAIKHSKKVSGAAKDRPKTTDVEYDPEAKKRYDENYEAIFRKSRRE